VGRGWNWFRIVPDGVFGIGNAERLGPATKEHADKQADMIKLSEIGCEAGDVWNWLKIVSSGKLPVQLPKLVS
jgi:hypothetical protein